MTRLAGARRLGRSSGTSLALIYTAIAVVMTWPLMRHPATRIASDLGDPLFNCWVLMWTGGQVLRALKGDFSAIGDYWNGNIFYPAPQTIAYSEHLTPQMLQMLPLYAAGANIFVCYNLLFLSTFVVAALGMYLLVRDMTGRPLAAFLAGLAFAYAPYRLGQFPHLQILSIGWMPLTLVGFRRYFATGRLSPLAWGAAAFVVQSLSCGYYMLFFAPVVAAFGLTEMVRRGRAHEWRVWMQLGVAALGVALLLWPFLRPYLALQATGILGTRSLGEADMFSADTHAFATIAPSARILGPLLSGFPKPEGEGFPGFTILAFALVAVIVAIAHTARRLPWASMRLGALALWSAAATLCALSLSALVIVLANGRLMLQTPGSIVTMQNATPLLWLVGASGLILAIATRVLAGAVPGDARALFWIGVAAAASLLAFGPTIHAAGHRVGAGPYTWLFAHVPGFNGLRVPARFLTIVTLALAALAGAGAAATLDGLPRPAGAIVVLAGAMTLLLESWIAPIGLDQRVIPEHLVAPGVPAVGRSLNPLYRIVATSPDPVVLVEFPFGEPAYDIQATFFAGIHRRSLVNGYSGFFPPAYGDLSSALGPAPADPDAARQALASSRATHALVHEGAFPDGRGRAITAWLISIGGRPIGTSGLDTLVELPKDLGGR